MILGIFGAGGLGREVLELAKIINEKDNRWEDIVFIDDAQFGKTINDVKVYSYADAVSHFKNNIEMTICVGEPETRKKLFDKIENDGIQAPTLIHPNVFIPKSTKIGKGVTIQCDCFISCNVVIEDYIYIQPQTSVGHDCVLHEGCSLSGKVSLAGAVEVGEYTYIGLCAVVKECVKIGKKTIIGMSSSVYNDIGDEVVAIGNPARIMKKNIDNRVFK